MSVTYTYKVSHRGAADENRCQREGQGAGRETEPLQDAEVPEQMQRFNRECIP